TFRSSPTGSGGVSATPWVTPEQMAIDANPINTHSQAGPYIQFQAFVEANTSTQLVPVFDDITVPFTVTGR
ncbi:MAG: hypothetical protein HY812_14040, partial [Planctomycetes bacterium]|nr:hypothetical protein [Planctomycetota bacterium]